MSYKLSGWEQELPDSNINYLPVIIFRKIRKKIRGTAKEWIAMGY
jgi:hypothetical protein